MKIYKQLEHFVHCGAFQDTISVVHRSLTLQELSNHPIRQAHGQKTCRLQIVVQELPHLVGVVVHLQGIDLSQL